MQENKTTSEIIVKKKLIQKKLVDTSRKDSNDLEILSFYLKFVQHFHWHFLTHATIENNDRF